jgi:hypothetical protein
MPSYDHTQIIDEFPIRRGQVSTHDGRLVLLTTNDGTTGTAPHDPGYLPAQRRSRPGGDRPR